jgi:hypothetical protein
MITIDGVTYEKDSIVWYQDKRYRVRWAGDTKHGQRAKIQQLDGTHEFWIHAHEMKASQDQTGAGESGMRAERKSFPMSLPAQGNGNGGTGAQLALIIATVRSFETRLEKIEDACSTLLDKLDPMV